MSVPNSRTFSPVKADMVCLPLVDDASRDTLPRCAPRRLGDAIGLGALAPISAQAMVPASTYSSSLPAGTPRASRVTFSPRSDRASPRKWAVVSPSAVKLVARMTSCTTPSVARRMTRSKSSSRGPMPSSGATRPISIVVQATVAVAGLDHVLVRRRLDDAQQRGIALGIGAGGADLVFGEVVAARAVAQVLHRACQRPAQHVRTLQIVLHQVVGHAPGRTHAHAGRRRRASISETSGSGSGSWGSMTRQPQPG